MIQVHRQDFNGRMITIRAEDVRAIACLFGVTPDSMGSRLDELGLLVNVWMKAIEGSRREQSRFSG